MLTCLFDTPGLQGVGILNSSTDLEAPCQERHSLNLSTLQDYKLTSLIHSNPPRVYSLSQIDEVQV